MFDQLYGGFDKQGCYELCDQNNISLVAPIKPKVNTPPERLERARLYNDPEVREGKNNGRTLPRIRPRILCTCQRQNVSNPCLLAALNLRASDILKEPHTPHLTIGRIFCGIPDVRLANSDDSVQVIVELKKPRESLSDHENQLIRYVRDLKAPYGMLSNGKEVWLYERSGLSVDRTAQHAVGDLAEDATVLEALRKRTVEPTDFA